MSEQPKLQPVTLTQQSKFELPGRYLLGLSLIIHLLREHAFLDGPQRVLSLKSGALHLGLVSSLLQETEMNEGVIWHGIDPNEDLVALNNALGGAKMVLLEVLANACVNYNNDSKPIPNGDLTPEAFKNHLERIKDVCGVVPWGYSEKHDAVAQLSCVEGVKADCSNPLILATISSMVGVRSVDAVFLGTLLLNMRKEHDDQTVSNWLSELKDTVMHPRGSFLVASLPPRDLMRTDTNTVDLIKQSGFEVLCILCDKYVRMDNGQLWGDYILLACPNGQSWMYKPLLTWLSDEIEDTCHGMEIARFWDTKPQFHRLGTTEMAPIAWLFHLGYPEHPRYEAMMNSTTLKKAPGHLFWDELTYRLCRRLLGME